MSHFTDAAYQNLKLMLKLSKHRKIHGFNIQICEHGNKEAPKQCNFTSIALNILLSLTPYLGSNYSR